jgi:hypothetical protein
MTIPPLPRSTMAGAKWWQSCIGTMQLRRTIASAASIGLARNGLKFGSAPAQYTRKPILRSPVAAAIAAAAPGSARSTASVRVWTDVRELISAAT